MFPSSTFILVKYSLVDSLVLMFSVALFTSIFFLSILLSLSNYLRPIKRIKNKMLWAPILKKMFILLFQSNCMLGQDRTTFQADRRLHVLVIGP